MQATNSLRLYEEVLLFGLDSQSGKKYGEHLKYAIAGAVLAELLITERIRMDSETLKVTVTDECSLEDDLLDRKLQLIAREKKLLKLAQWIRILPSYDIVATAAIRLCDREILRRQRKKILWIIPVTHYPLIDQAVKAESTQRVCDILNGVIDNPDSRSVHLLSLLFYSQIFHFAFACEKFSEEAVARLIELAEGEAIGFAINYVQEGIIEGRAKRAGMAAGRS